MMESFEQLMMNHIAFTLKTFPEATALSSITKLSKEMVEAAMIIGGPQCPRDTWQEDLAEEYADCMMCVLDSAARIGINPADLKRAFAAKIEKNKARTWVKNPDNTYSHVKAADVPPHIMQHLPTEQELRDAVSLFFTTTQKPSGV